MSTPTQGPRDEIRNAQLKAAVCPSVKVAYENYATALGDTVSNLLHAHILRDLAKATKAGKEGGKSRARAHSRQG